MREFLPETHAREKAGMPPEWRFYQCTNAGPSGDGALIGIKGCVPGVYKSGPRKGQPNWSNPVPGTEREVWLTLRGHDAWKSDWEQRTGKCSRCVGHGDLPWRSGPNGAEMKPCVACKGTGKADKTEAAE